MLAKKYIIVAVLLSLAWWGPVEGMTLRLGYLIAGPVATWWLLKYIWAQWLPDSDAEERFDVFPGNRTVGNLRISGYDGSPEMGQRHSSFAGVILLVLLFGELNR